MLLNIHVKNLALIDEVDVAFRDHLNILTGETGAGKSASTQRIRRYAPFWPIWISRQKVPRS